MICLNEIIVHLHYYRLALNIYFHWGTDLAIAKTNLRSSAIFPDGSGGFVYYARIERV